MQTITLGGQSRRVVYSIGAFRLAKIDHGATVTLADIEALDLETLPRLLWIGLLAHDPEMTERECMLMLAKEPEAEAHALDLIAGGMSHIMGLLRRFGSASTEAEAAQGKPEPLPETLAEAA